MAEPKCPECGVTGLDKIVASDSSERARDGKPVPLLIWPSSYQLLLSRFFRPWGNFERPANLFFVVPDGDRVVARGCDGCASSQFGR